MWATETAVEQQKEGEKSAEKKEKQREKLEELLLARVKQVLKERQGAKLEAELQAAEKESAKRQEEARLAEIRSSLRLPSARMHATVSTAPDSGMATSPSAAMHLHSLATAEGWSGQEAQPSLSEPPSPTKTDGSSHRRCNSNSYDPYPLQLVEGKLLLFDPAEFGLWPLMAQLRGWSLELGAAHVWGGGNEREAEAFSVACGFSVAFGPIVLRVVATAIYGRVSASGVSVLPTHHVVYAFGRYWETEVVPCVDAAERFFRLAKIGSGAAYKGGGGAGGVRKVGGGGESEAKMRRKIKRQQSWVPS